MATVNIIAVSKFHEKHLILNAINLQIDKGEFVAVVGPSGSGKSTLLRLVAGLEKVTAGKILINDQCVNSIPPSQRNMAMVFQNYALYPHMTVFANMAYGLKMRGMAKPEINKRVEEVATLLGLNDYLYRKPAALSGGQKQRVAMGRAIVRSPAVFLFDEPLSNLDTKLRTEMRREIKKLHNQLNTTCLYVTHDQTEAMTLADKIVILNHGNIEQVGTPQDVYLNPATLFVAGFIGHYPMNFVDAWLAGQLGVNIDEDTVLGIRPEYIELTTIKDSNTIAARVDFVDDMGADKLIQFRLQNNSPLWVRVFEDVNIPTTEVFLKFNLQKASLFSQKTGRRLGGIDGQEKH